MNTLHRHLGKHFAEINDSLKQEKYSGTRMPGLLTHRYKADTSTATLVVDPSLTGLNIIITGNRVRVSPGVLDHPAITFTDELSNRTCNPRAGYTPDVAASLSYLLCGNLLQLNVTGYVDRVIYITYLSDFETLNTTVLDVNVNDTAQVDIVETVTSYSLYSVMANYHVGGTAKLRLHTFYSNSVAGSSILARQVYLSDRATFTHGLLGAGSNVLVDETRLYPGFRSNSRIVGVTSTRAAQFRSVLTVHPEIEEYAVTVDYRNVLTMDSNVGYYAGVAGDSVSKRSYVNATELTIDKVDPDAAAVCVAEFVKDVMAEINITGRQDTAEFSKKKSEYKLIY